MDTKVEHSLDVSEVLPLHTCLEKHPNQEGDFPRLGLFYHSGCTKNFNFTSWGKSDCMLLLVVEMLKIVGFLLFVSFKILSGYSIAEV